MKRQILRVIIPAVALTLMFWFGFIAGKAAADKYYTDKIMPPEGTWLRIDGGMYCVSIDEDEQGRAFVHPNRDNPNCKMNGVGR